MTLDNADGAEEVARAVVTVVGVRLVDRRVLVPLAEGGPNFTPLVQALTRPVSFLLEVLR